MTDMGSSVFVMQIVLYSSKWNLRTRSVFADSWRKVSPGAASKAGKVGRQRFCKVVIQATFLASRKPERALPSDYSQEHEQVLYSVRYEEFLQIISFNLMVEGLAQIVAPTTRSCISSCLFCIGVVFSVHVLIMLGILLFQLKILKSRNFCWRCIFSPRRINKTGRPVI